VQCHLIIETTTVAVSSVLYFHGYLVVALNKTTKLPNILPNLLVLIKLMHLPNSPQPGNKTSEFNRFVYSRISNFKMILKAFQIRLFLYHFNFIAWLLNILILDKDSISPSQRSLMGVGSFSLSTRITTQYTNSYTCGYQKDVSSFKTIGDCSFSYYYVAKSII